MNVSFLFLWHLEYNLTTSCLLCGMCLLNVLKESYINSASPQASVCIFFCHPFNCISSRNAVFPSLSLTTGALLLLREKELAVSLSSVLRSLVDHFVLFTSFFLYFFHFMPYYVRSECLSYFHYASSAKASQLPESFICSLTIFLFSYYYFFFSFAAICFLRYLLLCSFAIGLFLFSQETLLTHCYFASI